MLMKLKHIKTNRELNFVLRYFNRCIDKQIVCIFNNIIHISIYCLSPIGHISFDQVEHVPSFSGVTECMFIRHKVCFPWMPFGLNFACPESIRPNFNRSISMLNI